MTNIDEHFQLLRDIRSTQLSQATEIAKMSGQLESLAGPEGRVKHLENTNDRQYWMHAGVVPVVLFLHGAARKLGFAI
jgi:hypothetical protein